MMMMGELENLEAKDLPLGTELMMMRPSDQLNKKQTNPYL